MKKNILLLLIVALLVIAPFSSLPAHALSCLPIGMYLKDIVGKEESVIFTGEAIDRLDETTHTAEVIEVDKVLQGYVEEKVFVYHQKHENWGYLCNTGPADKDTRGFYVASRDAFGKYTVSQRLELNDPLIKTLEADLKKAEVTGQVAELKATDRMNQIITTITDLIREIATLLKEFSYWKSKS